MYMYCCYDKVTKKYFPPFICQSDEEAKRSFIYAARQNPFKADLQLFKVGIFDETCKNTPISETLIDFVCDYPVETEAEL